MELCQVIQTLLGRPLDDAEQDCLRWVSAQGMAKLNADLIKGVPIEETLAMFVRVFTAAKDRRERLISSLPYKALAVLSNLNRVATTEELAFLSDCARFGVLHDYVDERLHLKKGIDLGECSDAYVVQRMEQAFHRLQSGPQQQLLPDSSKRLTLCSFAPTTCPSDLTKPLFVCSLSSTRAGLELSPTIAWFHEAAEDAVERVSEAAATFLMSLSGLAHSTRSKKCDRKVRFVDDRQNAVPVVGVKPSSIQTCSGKCQYRNPLAELVSETLAV